MLKKRIAKKEKKVSKKTEHISTKRDQYTVVLESIRSENKVVAELVMHLNDKFDSHTKDFNELKVNVELLRADVEQLKADTELIKGEVALIRHSQITRDEFKLLETRVARLERTRK
jgi:chromosome segregation ATPase